MLIRARCREGVAQAASRMEYETERVERDRARWAKGGAYKDVRPGPLDFRQRGTPELPILNRKSGGCRGANPFRGESIPSLPERKK